MKNIHGLLLLIMIIFYGTNCNIFTTKINNEDIIDWARENSVEIKTVEITADQNDLNLLGQIVGDAEVVCLGESRHDIREHFQLKHRFIKYLVEELGFTHFILEASMPYARKINEFLLHGNGNISEIMSNMPGWFIWDTQEMTDIIAWMKTYNENPGNKTKIQFHGMDITAPNYPLNQIFDYLKKVDPASLELFEKNSFAQDIVDDNFWPTSLQRYAALTANEKNVLQKNFTDLYQHLQDHKTTYISESTPEEYEWVMRLAYCTVKANEMFSADRRLDMGLIRDEAMASNILWTLQNLAVNKKTIIWAHNVHITKSEFSMTGEPHKIKGMGYLLAEALKDNMAVIGGSFNQGVIASKNTTFPAADESTLDGTLAQLNLDYLLLNLKEKPKDKDAIDWLNTNKLIRGQDFEMTCIPANSFDAIYFVDHISGAILNNKSAEKMRNLN